MTQSSPVVRRWLFRLAIAAAMALGAGYLPYRLFGPDGAAHALRLSGKLYELKLKNLEIYRANRALRREIHVLRDDQRAMERVARDELGLVKPNDLIFQFE